MGTVRVERCPDCLQMVGAGYLYEHQQTECRERERVRKQKVENWSGLDLANAILHRTQQMPKAVTYISLPRDWCEKAIELLLKGEK